MGQLPQWLPRSHGSAKRIGPLCVRRRRSMGISRAAASVLRVSSGHRPADPIFLVSLVSLEFLAKGCAALRDNPTEAHWWSIYPVVGHYTGACSKFRHVCCPRGWCRCCRPFSGIEIAGFFPGSHPGLQVMTRPRTGNGPRGGLCKCALFSCLGCHAGQEETPRGS